MSYAPVVDGPPWVEVGFAPPGRQHRLTVAFRWVLVIPHLFVLAIFGVVVEVTAFIGWFAALVLGRLPAGFDRLIGSYVQYAIRVYAYQNLLTGSYPPFDANAVDYPVRVWRSQQPLNRLAVFFRAVLQIPAYILLVLASFGLGLASFFIWLIVLVAGRMPSPLHLAVASVIRYQGRVLAYVLPVTPTYPWGLFGDRADAEATALTVATPGQPSWPVAPAPDGSGAPSYSPSDSTSDPISPSVPGAAVSDIWPGSVRDPNTTPEPSGPPATRLVLTAAAQRVVGLFLGLGVVGVVGYGVLLAVGVSSGMSGIQARSDLSSDYLSLTSAARTYQSRTAQCEQSGDLACAEQASRVLAAAFGKFGDSVGSISFPSADQGDGGRLQAASYAARRQLISMASAPTGQEFVSRAQAFQSTGAEFDSAYQQTQQALAG